MQHVAPVFLPLNLLEGGIGPFFGNTFGAVGVLEGHTRQGPHSERNRRGSKAFGIERWGKEQALVGFVYIGRAGGNLMVEMLFPGM